MCDRTQDSDPAHPQFWPNCLPKEEQIKKPKFLPPQLIFIHSQQITGIVALRVKEWTCVPYKTEKTDTELN